MSFIYSILLPIVSGFWRLANIEVRLWHWANILRSTHNPSSYRIFDSPELKISGFYRTNSWTVTWMYKVYVTPFQSHLIGCRRNRTKLHYRGRSENQSSSALHELTWQWTGSYSAPGSVLTLADSCSVFVAFFRACWKYWRTGAEVNYTS